jgi:drug/metabolite transporter (DMT)-like permease
MAYLLPFASSILYVLAVLFLKQATSAGVGIWRATAVTNLLCGPAFATLWGQGGRIPEAGLWYQPAAVALLFLASQALGFLAIQRGDVSVATPVMGLKVVLVALGVTLVVGDAVPAAVWAAAALSSAGILFLNAGGPKSGQAGPAILYGALAAAGFALFDVLVRKWAPAWGVGRFLPIMMGMVSLSALAQLALFHRSMGGAPPGARRSLYLGAALMVAQAVSLIGAIGHYANTTTINVVYSARGLWSVLAVWSIGPWFGNREREGGAAVFRARLVGAGLLLSAVVLAVFAP